VKVKSSLCVRAPRHIPVVVSHVAKLSRVSVLEHCVDFPVVSFCTKFTDHSNLHEKLISVGH